MRIAEGIEIPTDLVVQCAALIGRRGSGKTYAAGKVAEGMLKAGAQVVILDPIGNWWALRVAKDGKNPSAFSIPVLGGLRGDIPLEPEGGIDVADFIADTGSSAVLDVSQWSKTKRKTFVSQFGERLFLNKKRNPGALHLILEEAHVFAPQFTKGAESMVGAIDDIARQGRNFGIGCSLITQRPQAVNKDILNQADPIIVFQLVGAHERKAVREWLHYATGEDADWLSELPGLKAGDCFFCSPGWIDRFERTRFREKSTFDGSKTPTFSTRKPTGGVKAGAIAPVDLDALSEKMKSAIERAKENDPKQLRRRIAELERDLAKRPEESDAGISARLDLSKQVKVLTGALRDANIRIDRGRAMSVSVIERVAELKGDIQALQPIEISASVFALPAPANRPAPKATRPDVGKIGDTTLGGGALRMVQVLADRAPAGFTEAQWATLSKLKRTGGTWATYKSRIVRAGLVFEEGGLWRASAEAVTEYGDPSRKPQTSDEIIADWKAKLGSANGGLGRMVDALVEAGSAGLTREQLAARADLTPSAGTFSTYLSRLRSNGLIEDYGGNIAIRDMLVSSC